MNGQPKNVVCNEPRGVCRFEDKRLRKAVRWVLIRLQIMQIETNKNSETTFITLLKNYEIVLVFKRYHF